MKRDTEPMLDVVNGDIGMSRHLSKALKLIADSPGVDRDLRSQLVEVLAGKASIRDLARSESFTRLSEATMPKIAEDLARKTPEQIQLLAREGERILQKYRDEPYETVSASENDDGSRSPQPDRHQPAPPASNESPASRQGYPRSPNQVVPGTRKPDRDRIVTPDEPDEDDLYYRERQRRGWLE